jgi:hypothetical protein
MRRFVEGTDRAQSTLFPECLEDWIGEDNPVRVIDVFVDELGLAELGFKGVEPEVTGRPSYHPSVLLKLYIYGYPLHRRDKQVEDFDLHPMKIADLSRRTAHLIAPSRERGKFRPSHAFPKPSAAAEYPQRSSAGWIFLNRSIAVPRLMRSPLISTGYPSTSRFDHRQMDSLLPALVAEAEELELI